MQGYNLIYICDYAAMYSGNFIPSLSALAAKAAEHNNVYFLFPEQAKGIHWLKNLNMDPDHILFCDFYPVNIYKFCKQLSARLPDAPVVVHTHFVDRLCLLGIRLVFPKHIFHYHMSTPERKGLDKKIKRIARNLIALDSIIIGVSKAVAENLKTFYPFNDCIYIPNAVAFDQLEQFSANRPLHDYIERDSFSALIHGTNFFVKGTDIAIRAVEELNQEERCNCTLYITTNNIPETTKTVSETCGNCKNIRIIDVVEDVKNLYDSVDLFLSPSRQDAGPYSILESSYSDCQVVVSDIPGPDGMKDIPGILWVESEDVEGLKKAILTAYANKQQGIVSDINAMQKKYVVENYNVSRWVEQNMEVYNRYFP